MPHYLSLPEVFLLFVTCFTELNDLMGKKQSCPLGWSQFNGRCFRYFFSHITWAQAEVISSQILLSYKRNILWLILCKKFISLLQRHCLSLNANLASIQSHSEYIYIQRLIRESGGGSGETWIGGSDAEEVSVQTFFFFCYLSIFQTNLWIMQLLSPE